MLGMSALTGGQWLIKCVFGAWQIIDTSLLRTIGNFRGNKISNYWWIQNNWIDRIILELKFRDNFLLKYKEQSRSQSSCRSTQSRLISVYNRRVNSDAALQPSCQKLAGKNHALLSWIKIIFQNSCTFVSKSQFLYLTQISFWNFCEENSSI